MSSTRRRQASAVVKSAEESEESVSRALEDLGLLEDGMTFQDKKELLSVVRMSENTAHAEEEDRKSKDYLPESKEEDPNCVIEDVESDDDETQDIFPISPEVSSTSRLVRSSTSAPSSPLTRKVPTSTTSPPTQRTFCLPTDLAALSEISTTSPQKTTSGDTSTRTDIDSTSPLVRSSYFHPTNEISTTSSSVKRYCSLTAVNTPSEIGSTSPAQKKTQSDISTTSPFVNRMAANSSSSSRTLSPTCEILAEIRSTPSSQTRPKFQMKNPTPKPWLTVSAQADSSKKNAEPESKDTDSYEADEVNVSLIEESSPPGNEKEECMPSSINEEPSKLVSTERTNDENSSNIDVFSYTSNAYQSKVLRRKLRRAQDRIPFYFVPNGMDIHRYTIYFTQYVDGYFRRLAALQRRSVEHLKWGDPIIMGEGESNSCKRYNFRDRLTKARLVEFPSENSDEGGEDDSNDEDMFTIRNKRLPGIRLGAKRKLQLSNDLPSQKRERKDTMLTNKKAQNTSVASIESEKLLTSETQSEPFTQVVINDSSDDFIVDKNVSEGKPEPVPRKRARKKPQKMEVLDADEEVSDRKGSRSRRAIPTFQMTRRQTQIMTALTQNQDSVDRSEHTGLRGDENEEGWQPDESIVIKPCPLNVRTRRKLHPNIANTEHQMKRKAEPIMHDTDVVELYQSSNKAPEADDDKIPCPICRNTFFAAEIEEHASECNQYSEDLRTGPHSEREGADEAS